MENTIGKPQMKDAQFMSAKEKEMTLKQWIAFVKNGFKWEHFTDRLYKHLTLHAEFIAHYNRRGFFDTYFVEPDDTIRFLKQFDKDFGNVSVEYGWTGWVSSQEYGDINTAMCEAIEPHKKDIYERCLNAERQRDVSIANALLQKHGIRQIDVSLQSANNNPGGN